MKGNNASNRIVVQYHILFIIENIDNSISYHASQVLSFCWVYLSALQPFCHLGTPDILMHLSWNSIKN